MTWEWGAICRPKQGQSVSGDTYLAIEHGTSDLTVAVIDGLGGGEEAARAAHSAERAIVAHISWPLQDLIQHAHTALHSTRGAVIGLLRLEAASSQVTFVGVGNIGIRVYSRQPIRPISKNGILGFRLPKLLEMRYVYDPGDVFVLYSDGISNRFSQDGQVDLKQPAQTLANQILEQYGKPIDDATVVVVKT